MMSSFIAVDIGNARLKIGLFEAVVGKGLPEPLRTLSLDGDSPQLDDLASWLDDLIEKKGTGASLHSEPVPFLSWILASVNRPGATRLIEWLREHRPEDEITLLSAGDLPLEVRLERPDMVGIDRLVDAVAVNRLRESDRSAIIVDVGTAITVDLVSADGAFLGGSILPGLAIAARALHQFTDLLPLVDIAEFSDPPPALGASTETAMRSGLFWGTVGAIHEMIEQLTRQKGTGTSLHSEPVPQVFLTGGAGATVAELLSPDAQFIPHLTLAGIVLAIH